MLRITPSTHAAGAKTYYTEALSHDDYYTREEEVPGRWGGYGAKMLGLEGEVTKKQFHALCDNRDPWTGKRLTARTKDNRRVGFDFTFSVPKSVSAIFALTGDRRVLDAFQKSVDETMEEIEQSAATRVRRNGTNGQRTTANLAWGRFIHFTARPVDGVSDPHLHAHCFTFNATFDPLEDRWKAAEVGDLKRDARYFEAAFDARLGKCLEEMGIAVERRGKGWEIAAVPDSVIAKFSRRTAEIERMAREKGIVNPETKGHLGARTRQRKVHESPVSELRSVWNSKLTETERRAVHSVASKMLRSELKGRMSDREAVDHSLHHSFERSSVRSDKEILGEALRAGIGTVSVAGVQREFSARKDVLKRRDGTLVRCTTREVLAEERSMIAFARDGRGTCHALGPVGFKIANEQLGNDQRDAILHVLSSTDRVISITGGAGAGKTTLLKEAVRGIEEGGRRVIALAPSAEASRGVLAAEGFNADTVARFLVDSRKQEEARGQVLLVDEAGLLSSRGMGHVFEKAATLGCRVVLVGDASQNAPIERGDALRVLEQHGGIRSVEVTKIRRQKGTYKAAVKAIREGEMEKGFALLEEMGAFHVGPDDRRYETLAKDYVRAVAAGASTLVVSPTHRESETVTKAIRAALRDEGLLGTDSHLLARLVVVPWTEAERKRPDCYSPGMIVQFHQNTRGFVRGDRVEVMGLEQTGDVRVKRADGAAMRLPLGEASRFQVFERREIEICSGERVRITHNGVTADGKHRLNNGADYRVRCFSSKGNLVLENGWEIARDSGHFAHGYVSTSFAAQGKTVDRVFVAQDSASFGAASKEAFYVAVSRGRNEINVYSDDNAALREQVARSAARVSAVDVMAKPLEDRPKVSWRDRATWVNRLAGYARSVAQLARDHGRDLLERTGLHRRTELERS